VRISGCAAVDAYDKYLGVALESAPEPVALDVGDIGAAQAEVQAAEDDLWRLREELLGWARPASATRAGLVADWFSDEDRVYDESPANT